MKTKLILVCFATTLFFANPAWAQFNWPFEIPQPTIEVIELGNHTRVEVTGTDFAERVEVERVGGSAIVGVYSPAGYLLTHKWITGRPTGFQLDRNSGPFGIRAAPTNIFLSCELKGGNDSFQCDATIFDSIYVAAGAGDDVIHCGPAGSIVWGGSGDDLIIGSDKEDFLDGGDGNDMIGGGEGDDFLFGGDGSDALFATFGGSDQVVTGDLFSFYAYDDYEDDAVDYFTIDSDDTLLKGQGDYGTVAVVVEE